jgi:flagellar hook-basal body complex protein FliE
LANPVTGLSPALARYAQAIDRAKEPGDGGGPPAATFGGLLEKVMADALEAGRRSEAAATRAVIGQANLQDVVEAVNAAEITLQTVVALRDRMIGAYQDIARMPI